MLNLNQQRVRNDSVKSILVVNQLAQFVTVEEVYQIIDLSQTTLI